MPITRRSAIALMGAAGSSVALPSLRALPVRPEEVPAAHNPAGFQVGQYDLVWSSQSRNASESMPCGGGDIGLNVWVENGDILFYMARSGSFDELNGMPKLGRLRVQLDPNPFSPGATFTQRLSLQQGHVEITGEQNGFRAVCTVWVDVHSPVVHVSVEAEKPTSVRASYESWRTKDRFDLPGEESGHRSWGGAPRKAEHIPDKTAFIGNDVVSFHRNRDVSTAFDICVEQQQLAKVKDQLWNPIRGLAFGVLMRGKGFTPAGESDGKYASTDFHAWTLESRNPGRRHHLRTYLHVDYVTSDEQWLEGVRSLASRDEAAGDGPRRKTLAWWNEFWDRSYIALDAGTPAPDSVAWRIGRNYQLFRYQLGTNAYGKYPTKFNGGLYTFDPEFVVPQLKYNPDFREWGGGSFTAQNQRLVYWPMLKSGDFDMMESQFQFYLQMLKNAELRTQVYWHHNGASFTEQIENFGLPVAWEYGWNRLWYVDPGLQFNRYVDRLWETSLEFCLMMLETVSYAGADISRYMPLIHSCVVFFDEHFQQHLQKTTGQPLNDEGKLVFYPGTACETYKDTFNSAVTIAGLMTVLEKLLALPQLSLSPEHRAYYQAYLQRIPALPFRHMGGKRVLAPAALFDRIQNVEIPQLYPVYPYGMYGIGKPDLQAAIDTWHYGVETADQKNYISWHQDAIFCARLGLTDEATAVTIKKMDDSGRRCPTFWGPGHDWVPDHNWGGSGMIGLQEMLLQCVDGKLYLLPAWPKQWDVHFKLHAEAGTIVEGKLTAGKLQDLSVTPATRSKDLVLPAWCSLPQHA